MGGVGVHEVWFTLHLIYCIMKRNVPTAVTLTERALGFIELSRSGHLHNN